MTSWRLVGYGPGASAGEGMAYRPGPVSVSMPRRAHSASWVSMLRGLMPRECPVTALAPVLQAFFTQRLIAQRQVSSHTIAAYRDTFRLLLGFAQQRTGTEPCDLRLDDLDAALIGDFLEHLRRDRRNGARNRNARRALAHGR